MNSTRHKTHHAITQGGNSLSRYQDVIVGRRSIATTLYFEFCAWLAPIPGAVGLFLRKLFWPHLFAACGTGVIFGRGIILRHPGRVSLGQQVVIGDGATLDGRSSSLQLSLTIGDDVMIADHCALSCKEGMLRIGNRVGLGTQTVIQSTHQCPTSIGDDVIIGPGSKELMFILQMVHNGHLAIPSPSWVSYEPQAELIGKRVDWIPTAADNGWRVTPEALEHLCA